MRLLSPCGVRTGLVGLVGASALLGLNNAGSTRDLAQKTLRMIRESQVKLARAEPHQLFSLVTRNFPESCALSRTLW